jgi:hypothetical protein
MSLALTSATSPTLLLKAEAGRALLPLSTLLALGLISDAADLAESAADSAAALRSGTDAPDSGLLMLPMSGKGGACGRGTRGQSAGQGARSKCVLRAVTACTF